MKRSIARFRRTRNERSVGVVRLLLGAIFAMTGMMKLAVPQLADAWSGQLLAAEIPLYALSRWSVPFVEIALGIALLVGIASRVAALVTIGIMLVATYVHVVVDDPTLFPLQPSEPVIPVMVMLMSCYVLWRGGGAWSIDLKTEDT